jgi:hypothetical protein
MFLAYEADILALHVQAANLLEMPPQDLHRVPIANSSYQQEDAGVINENFDSILHPWFTLLALLFH